jgi:xanthine dehydrogenase YagS FAD-binding subunit
LALGGVAHKPWRARKSEALLRGAPATDENFSAAASAELQDAHALPHNAFKIELAKRAIVASLVELLDVRRRGKAIGRRPSNGNGREQT